MAGRRPRNEWLPAWLRPRLLAGCSEELERPAPFRAGGKATLPVDLQVLLELWQAAM